MSNNSWSGETIIKKANTNEGLQGQSCKWVQSKLDYPSINKIDVNSNIKSIAELYNEPPAILFHAEKCGVEPKNKRGSGKDQYYNVFPHYNEVYRRVDCDEDNKTLCKPYSREDVLNAGLYDSKQFMPFYEKYYSLHTLNYGSDKEKYNIYGSTLDNEICFQNNMPSHQKNLNSAECKSDSSNSYIYTPDIISDKIAIWGPSSSYVDYGNGDVSEFPYWQNYNGEYIDSNNKKSTGNIFVDPRYQGFDKTKLYARDENGKLTNHALKTPESVHSVLLPPHLMLDMFENSAYNTDYAQTTVPSKYTSIGKEQPDDMLNRAKNKQMIRITSKSIKTKDDLETEKIPIIWSTTDTEYDPKPTELIFGDHNNDISYVSTDYIDNFNDIEHTDDNNINGSNNLHNIWNPQKPGSAQALRKLPWAVFIRNCALGLPGYQDEKLCKNYTNYFMKSGTKVPNTQTDADKFMYNYCLMKKDGKIIPYDDRSINTTEKNKEITKNNGWKYDETNEICGCVRYGIDKGGDACGITDCARGTATYIPDNRRADGNCNTVIQNCISVIKIESGDDSTNIAKDNEAYNNCMIIANGGSNDENPIIDETTGEPIKPAEPPKPADSGSSTSELTKNQIIILVLILLIVVIGFIIMFVVVPLSKSNKNKLQL